MSRNELNRSLVNFLNKHFDLEERMSFFRKRKLYTLEVELTDRCNLGCFYCYREAGPEGRLFLPLMKAKEILEQAKDYGIRQMVWLGGEPTLHPDWARIVRYARNLDLTNELWSNGTTLNSENIERITELCDTFVLHLDSIDPTCFSFVQQNRENAARQHQKILDGFDRLLDGGFPSKHARLNVVLCRKTLSNLLPTLDHFMADRKVGTTTLIPLYSSGRGRIVEMDEFLSGAELKGAFLKRAEIEGKPELMLLGVSELDKWRQMTTAYISAEGDVTPYAGIKMSVGNVYRENLREILERSFDDLSFAGAVSLDGIANYIEGQCGSCRNSRYCFGTRANSVFTFGKLDESDPACWLTQK